MERKLTLEILEKCVKEIWKDPFIELDIIYINNKAKEKLSKKIIEHINEMEQFNNVSKAGIDENICK